MYFNVLHNSLSALDYSIKSSIAKSWTQSFVGRDANHAAVFTVLISSKFAYCFPSVSKVFVNLNFDEGQMCKTHFDSNIFLHMKIFFFHLMAVKDHIFIILIFWYIGGKQRLQTSNHHHHMGQCRYEVDMSRGQV